MAALGINVGFLIFQILNFAIVAILLYKWAYGPMMKALENRKQKIAMALEDARVAAEARANAEEEARQIIAKSQAEAAEKVREASQRAEHAIGEVKVLAEAEATQTREQARADALVERERILGDLRGQIASLAIAAAQKLIGEALDEKRQHELVDQFFSGVKSGKVVVLENLDVKGSTAEVVSALPLTEAERETLKAEITEKAGAGTIVFSVDPNILGGLIVKVGEKVLDGSVAGQLVSMRERLS